MSKIIAIDTHCHIHYGPKENLVLNYLTDIMRKGNFYTAYPDKIKQISESAYIGKVFASPFDGILDSSRTEQANGDMLI